MTIWIDGDSCASPAREAALEIGKQRQLTVKVVADRYLKGVKEQDAHLILVKQGSGQTDRSIIDASSTGDVVITRDLELAHLLMQKGLQVMNDRGKIWTKRSLQHRKEEAAIMQAMKNGGMIIRRGSNYNAKNLALFIKSLNRWLDSSSHSPQ